MMSIVLTKSNGTVFNVDYITSIGPDKLLSRHNFAGYLSLAEALQMTEHIYKNGTNDCDPETIVSVIIQRQD